MEFNDLGFATDHYPSAENYRDGTTMTASTSGSQPTGQGSNQKMSAGGKRRGGNNGVKLDDSSSVIESILSAIEHRGENGLQHHGGPLTNTEVAKLSMLCTQQLELSNRRKNGILNDNSGSILSQDLGFADVDADMMAQLVEHLEKHVALASQIDLIQSSYETIHRLKKGENVGCSSIDEWIRKGKGSELLTTLCSGLETAMILLSIMTSPGIDRRVVKEDAIVACLILMRHNLTKNILPAINNCGHIVAGMSKSQLHASPVATKKRRRRSSGFAGSDAAVIKDMGKCYKLAIFQTIGNTVVLMERLDALIQKVPLDDQHLMTCSAGALVSMELDPSTEVAASQTHQLHVASIGIVTSIFRNHSKLRPMIIEDLFALMLKMPSGKRGMRTYPVQCSSILYPKQAWELSKSLGSTSDNHNIWSSSTPKIQPISIAIMNFVHSSVTRPTFVEPSTANANDRFGNEDPKIGTSRLSSGLRDCQTISDFFVNHLLSRCSKKGEDGGASEFRPILNNLIEDLLIVLLAPEYPAAEMILLSIANAMYRDIIKMTSGKAAKESTTTTYFNTIFDVLGKICSAVAKIKKWNEDHPARLDPPVIYDNKSAIKHVDSYCKETEDIGDKFMVKCDMCNTWYYGDCVGVSRDTLPEKWLCDCCQFDRIVQFERDRNTNLGELGCPAQLIDRPYCLRRLVVDYLSILTQKTSSKGIRDVYGFQLARWLKILETKNAQNNYLDENDSLPVIAGLIELWDPQYSPGVYQGDDAGSLNGMLNCMSDEGRSRMVVEFVCKISSLLTSFKGQVGRIVKLLESPSKSVRKLSLKAIEKIADADPNLMTNPFMRNAVTRRFSDESISVRDAVVSLVGSYVLNTPAVADAFHPALINGLTDSGLSVRKRTVHVFRDILCTNPTYTGRAEACSGMLRLAADPKEDDTVRDLIYDLFSTIWLDSGEKRSDGQRLSSHIISNFDNLISPGSKVSNVEELSLSTTPSGPPSAAKTPAGVNLIPATPNGWSTVTKSTRSTAKKSRSRYNQLRCQAAAQQMVEVVTAANTEHHLTLLFRELLSDTSDSDKNRKSSARKKRKGRALTHVSMLVDALFEMLLNVEEDNEKSTTDKGEELVSIFRTLRVFTDASPTHVLRHIDTLLPYLKIDNGLRPSDEANIACSLCGVLSRVIPELDYEDCERLIETSLADDLAGITKRWGKAASSSAVQALCLFSAKEKTDQPGFFGKKLLELAKVFFSYLVKVGNSGDYTMKKKTKNHVSRALSVLGAVCRYCESSSFDSMEEEDDNDELNPEELSLLNIAPACERIFMKFYVKDDVMTKVAAIQALAGVFMAHPRQMLNLENNGLITEVMASNSPGPVQRESLRCWRDILLEEESRVESGEAKAKMDSKKNITVSKKISGDQDADATLFGGILTNHATRLFQMTKSRDKSIRFAAVELVGHLLRQGQLNPNEATPHLLALQGDVEENIRSNALKFLTLEGEKRPDMLRQRLCAGVKQAYLFQAAVFPNLEEVSALISVTKDGSVQTQCVFGSVYKNCIARNKKQRRGLFRNLLALFDPQNLKKHDSKNINSAMSSLRLLSYTSQVLAYLPYYVPSDPLYIIYYILSNIALQGADLLDNFATFLRPYGLSSADELDEVNAEEDELEIAANRHSPHPAKHIPVFSESFDKVGFFRLCSEAGCLILLLRLKNFLRETYNLSEARCIGFNPDKKEVGEKPISRASSSSFFHSKLPTFVKNHEEGSVDPLDAMILQYAEFRRLMRSEVNNSTLLDDEDDLENDVVSDEERVDAKRQKLNSDDEEQDLEMLH